MKPTDDEEDDTSGRFDAYETIRGETGVWSPTTDLHYETKSYEEAERMAKAMATEYAAERS